jgi:type IV pilus assembly protein PilN
MARINLLPWRAEIRKQQQKDFITAMLLSMGLTAALMLLVHVDIATRIDYQSSRNHYLNAEISILDKRIKEIQDLEATKKKMLTKMDVIQQLQTSRPEIVHLFDELARTTPEGVYLSDLTQTDKVIIINGFAQSNARVSSYMRNLESSVWLKSPLLSIIETKLDARDANKKERQNKFTLQVKQASSDKPETKSVNKSAKKP